MKKLVVTIVGVLTILLTSCSQNVVFEVSMEVTPMEVRNGDEITISFIKSEDTNVDFKAEVFWEDEKIGEVSKAPYQLKYVANGMEEGFYSIKGAVSYKKKTGTMSSSASMNHFKIIKVIE